MRLVLSRKIGEAIIINDEIELVVASISRQPESVILEIRPFGPNFSGGGFIKPVTLSPREEFTVMAGVKCMFIGLNTEARLSFTTEEKIPIFRKEV